MHDATIIYWYSNDSFQPSDHTVNIKQKSSQESTTYRGLLQLFWRQTGFRKVIDLKFLYSILY